MRSLAPPGCLSLIIFLMLLLVLPLFLADAVLSALAKLGLSPRISFLVLIGIFFGGMINVPVKRISREEPIDLVPFRLFGFDRIISYRIPHRSYTIIAVNIGGCVVPCIVAIYELFRIADGGSIALMAAIGSIAINTAVCYWLARPVPNLGIAMPALVPAFVAALCALAFMPELAPQIAFSAGVLGPLLGADLLHLRDMHRVGAGILSIGGAGTFDGIVLSALIATLLA